MKRAAASLALVLGAACGSSDETAEGDREERAAFVEGHGFAYVGFAPAGESGIDGKITIRPGPVTVTNGVVRAFLSVQLLLQQGVVEGSGVGAFTNGWVAEASKNQDVNMSSPRYPQETLVKDERRELGFRDDEAYKIEWARLSTGLLEQSRMRYRLARAAMVELQVDYQVPVFPVMRPTRKIAYAYFEGASVGLALPKPDVEQKAANAESGFTRITTPSGLGRSIALTFEGDTAWIAAVMQAPPENKETARIYSSDGATITQVAEVLVPAEMNGSPLRIFRAAGQTYIVSAPNPPVRLVYQVSGATLTPVTLPPGSDHTFAIAEDGALVIGFSDAAQGNRASVSKLVNGTLQIVGAGFSRDAVTATVSTVGPNIYASFTSATDRTGMVVACAGPSCVPYSRRVVAPPVVKPSYCLIGKTACGQTENPTADFNYDFEQRCVGDKVEGKVVAECPPETLGGACITRTPEGNTITYYNPKVVPQEAVVQLCSGSKQEYLPPASP